MRKYKYSEQIIKDIREFSNNDEKLVHINIFEMSIEYGYFPY